MYSRRSRWLLAHAAQARVIKTSKQTALIYAGFRQPFARCASHPRNGPKRLRAEQGPVGTYRCATERRVTGNGNAFCTGHARFAVQRELDDMKTTQ